MKPITRDILVGITGGLIAVAVLSFRREKVEIPPGLYQASLDLAKFREMSAMLRPPASSAATLQKLQTKLDAPDVQGAAFDQILVYLADMAGVEIHVDWTVLANVGIDRNAPVHARLSGVTVAQALRQTLSSASTTSSGRLNYQIDGARIRVSTDDVLSKEYVTRVYDVHDIISAIVNAEQSLFKTKRPAGAPSPGTGGLFDRAPGNPREVPELLIRHMQETIDPSSWRDYGGSAGGQVRYMAGKLVITQTLPNQDQIALWLLTLKQEILEVATR